MKKLIFIIAAIAATITTDAQTVQRDASGNFYSTKAEKAPHDSTTTYTAKLNRRGAAAIEEPVYIGAKGSFYVARISKKSGNYYRKYLKHEE
ncbi:MAG: hypothetical protein ACI9DM_000244 [Cyclobacteriaceae bacterium]|jgi:hypothetical protein